MYEHLEYYGVSKRVIEAMNKIDRKLFVPVELRESAYIDTPLPIGYGQTISAPHMIGLMCEYLDLKEGDKVLEIGTGSGYNAAVMSLLVGRTGKIYTVEVVEPLYKQAKALLESLMLENIKVFLSDGKSGLKEYAPYDKITVTCYSKKIPPALIEQLSEGGILLIPIGNEYVQVLKRIRKQENRILEENLGDVRFVPMV
ncbi:protein-L-isoaspartate O-methyltransferase [Fervidobacterium sp.]